MMNHILMEDCYEGVMTLEIALDLMDKGIIYPCVALVPGSEEEMGTCSYANQMIYHVQPTFEWLTNDDLDALCNGVLVEGATA